jgi:hypothetical protein
MEIEKELPKRKRTDWKGMIMIPAVRISSRYVRWKDVIIFERM